LDAGGGHSFSIVMPGFMPGIHAFTSSKTWMAGTLASGSDAVLWTAMPGHDAI
jgi:hypothetical protein